METCHCGEVGRYQLADGSSRCEKHLPDVGVPTQPTACKVFSGTRSREREFLGERVTEWLKQNNVEVTNTFFVQSSDAAFHCLSMVLFYRER